MTHSTHASPAARSAGITIMEMLIAVSISSMLLASVGVAIDACFRANAVNQDQSNLTQRSRQAINRIITDIRGTTAHSPINIAPQADFELGKVTTDSGIEMIVGEESAKVVVKYQFDAATKQLKYTDPSKKTFVAVNNVEAFSVKFEPMKSELAQQTGQPFDQLLRATVTITVRADKVPGQSESGEVLTLSTSVMPRRNTW
jgi:hypothetical protein